MEEEQTNLTEANKDHEVQSSVPRFRQLVRYTLGGGGSSGDGRSIAFCKMLPILRLLRLFAAIGLLLFAPLAQAQFTWTTNADNTITITGYTGSGGDVAMP